MSGTTEILLFAVDDSAADVVRQVATEIGPLNIKLVDEANRAVEYLKRGNVAVLLAGITGRRDEKRVSLLLQRLAETGLRLPIIVFSRQKDVEQNCRLLRMGVLECMSRPIDTSRLAMLLEVFTIRPNRRPATVQPQTEQLAKPLPERIKDFVLGSETLENLMQELRRVAPLETTILITGETGTGKTHLARVIHDLSPRMSKPFVVMPCGAVPPSLLESEMFGHVRGAFTHADRDRIGKFLHVGDGTLLLDEVDCVPLEGQMKLLRVVEERTFEPVGANTTHTLRARLIVATNRPLHEEIEAGRFRADLYYRLKVVEFSVPPLRERPESIRHLAETFLDKASTRAGRSVAGLSDAALRALEAYRWPGNVRELRNVIERAVALGQQSVIDLDDLPENIAKAGRRPTPTSLPLATADAGNALAKARSHAEKARLIRALDRNDNNRTTTAVELGISRVTLYKKLHKHGLA